MIVANSLNDSSVCIQNDFFRMILEKKNDFGVKDQKKHNISSESCYRAFFPPSVILCKNILRAFNSTNFSNIFFWFF